MSKGGWGGFSVPGHSGTQFKHRKAFAGRQQNVHNAKRTQGSSAGVEPRPRKVLRPFWLWFYRILVGLLSVLLVWGLLSTYQQFTKPTTIDAKAQMEAERYQTEGAYEKLLEIAEGELANGQYWQAIEDFERYLEHEPTSERALNGLQEARELLEE